MASACEFEVGAGRGGLSLEGTEDRIIICWRQRKLNSENRDKSAFRASELANRISSPVADFSSYWCCKLSARFATVLGHFSCEKLPRDSWLTDYRCQAHDLTYVPFREVGRLLVFESCP